MKRKSIYTYIVVGATALAVFLYFYLDHKVEETQKAAEQELISSRAAQLSEWRRADSGFGSEKTYILGSQAVEIGGTNAKVSLMILRLPDGIETVAIGFSQPPPTAPSKKVWVHILAYSHPNVMTSANRSILFSSQAADEDDGMSYVAIKYSDIGWIIELADSTRKRNFALFGLNFCFLA